MKNSVYFNYIIGYLIFAIIALLGINYYIDPLVYDFVTDIQGDETYKTAYSISQRYGKYHYDIENGSYNYMEELTSIAFSTNTIIWITDDDGTMLYSSEDYYRTKRVDNLADYFKHDCYSYGTFNNLFAQPYTSSAAPIVNGYNTYGYVIVSKSSSYINVIVFNILFLFI